MVENHAEGDSVWLCVDFLVVLFSWSYRVFSTYVLILQFVIINHSIRIGNYCERRGSMSCCTVDILSKATCNCMGKGPKMDGWETAFLSFWDTAYFQGRTCCEFPGRGKLSNWHNNLYQPQTQRRDSMVDTGIIRNYTAVSLSCQKGTFQKENSLPTSIFQGIC